MLPITFMMALATLKASAQNPDFLTLSRLLHKHLQVITLSLGGLKLPITVSLSNPTLRKPSPPSMVSIANSSSAWVVRSKTSVSKPLSYSTKLM